jgi:hypothetical protein
MRRCHRTDKVEDITENVAVKKRTDFRSVMGRLSPPSQTFVKIGVGREGTEDFMLPDDPLHGG